MLDLDSDLSLQENFLNGKVLLIDKPLDWTSFDVVKKVRNTIKIKKVGHAGTLDPLASGLLIVCTGKKTKTIESLMAKEKEYTGTITIGATTPTYDLESSPENEQSFSHITLENIEDARKMFLGELMQMPPMFSAIKIKGTRLYDLARRGEKVALEPRPVNIFEFEITNVSLPSIEFRVVCSKGTYIRSLAHDFGEVLKVGGYLSALRRTKIGNFDVKDAHELPILIDTIKAFNENSPGN